MDTSARKSNRLIWVKEWYDVLTDKYANVAMLDEKWFYTTNRRRKIKKLPIRPGEMDGDDTLGVRSNHNTVIWYTKLVIWSL